MNTSDAVRATFVMKKGNRDLVRGIAHRYGVSQSEIMNTAPYLFIVMAERSLAERRGRLSAAKTIADQARRSLDSLPRHLVLGDAHERIDDAIALEGLSIERNQVHGPGEADIEELMQRSFVPNGDPFRETVLAALHEAGAKATAERFAAMHSSGSDDDETFLDEEEEAERDASLAELLGTLDLEGLSLDEANTADVITRSQPAIGEWHIILKSHEITASTGGEALERVLKHLAGQDQAALEKLRNVKGRVRPLIGRTPEQLYPGRPDLGEHAREFMPGWFVGTNYSRRDVMRLLRAAAEKVGLVWGVDVYVKTTPIRRGG